MTRNAVVLAACLSLAGCGSLTGLDASNKFACKAPDGVTCLSLSGVYADALDKKLPGQREKQTPPAAAAMPTSARASAAPGNSSVAAPPLSVPRADMSARSPRDMSAPNSGSPVRSPEAVMRIWVAPYEDADGDLHDQKYVYVTLQRGRWLIEHTQANIRSRFQTVTPLQRSADPPSQAGAAPPALPLRPGQDAVPNSPMQ